MNAVMYIVTVILGITMTGIAFCEDPAWVKAFTAAFILCSHIWLYCGWSFIFDKVEDILKEVKKNDTEMRPLSKDH